MKAFMGKRLHKHTFVLCMCMYAHLYLSMHLCRASEKDLMKQEKHIISNFTITQHNKLNASQQFEIVLHEYVALNRKSLQLTKFTQ